MEGTFVVDANIFIKNLNELVRLAQNQNIVSTPSVLLELKDKRTLENVKTFLPNLKTYQPTNRSVDYVTQISKKTGDFTSLSDQDIELVALAIDFLIQEKSFQYKDLDKPVEEKPEEKQPQGWGYFADESQGGWVGGDSQQK